MLPQIQNSIEMHPLLRLIARGPVQYKSKERLNNLLLNVNEDLYQHLVALCNALNHILTSPPTNRELLAAQANGTFNWQDFLEKATGISISDLQKQNQKLAAAHKTKDTETLDQVGDYLNQKVMPRLRFLSGNRTTKLEGQLAKHHELAKQLGHKAIGAKDEDHLHAFFKTEGPNRTLTNLNTQLQNKQIDKKTYNQEVAKIEAKRDKKFEEINKTRGKKGPIDKAHVTTLTSKMYGIYRLMNREQQRMAAFYSKALDESLKVRELQQQYHKAKNEILGLSKIGLSKREIL